MEVVVIKMGGSLQGQSLKTIARTIRLLQAQDRYAVLVHGGGPQISRRLQEQNLEMPWHQGQRVTTAAAMAVVHQVLCREVNASLVSNLIGLGLPATGLCGGDGIILARALPGLDCTGDVTAIKVGPIGEVLARGKVPVIAPVGVVIDGQLCNINADLSAASLAAALHADRAVFLTDVDGIYYDFRRQLRLTDTTPSVLGRFLQQGAFDTGMIPKVRAVLRALDNGVPAAYVVNGGDGAGVAEAATRPLTQAWDEAAGTRITSLRGGESIEYTWH